MSASQKKVFTMQGLLGFSRLIDRCSEQIGTLVKWLIFATVIISSGNAISRKAFSLTSNAMIEVQWYLFSAAFMLGAGYAFLRNVHVRIDFISSKLTARTRNWIDIIGIIVFLIPLCILMVDLSWPLFHRAWVSGEMSSNAGGLIRWPVLLLIPAGFVILLAQAISELIKRFAFLRGLIPDPLESNDGPSEEERLARELAERANAPMPHAKS
jgi:TRAP-type mannitol/chloroaromatic compound transport system permease small subunit